MGKRRRSRERNQTDQLAIKAQNEANLKANAVAEADRIEKERLSAISAKEEQARDQVRTAKTRQRTILTGGANRGVTNTKSNALGSLLGGR